MKLTLIILRSAVCSFLLVFSAPQILLAQINADVETFDGQKQSLELLQIQADGNIVSNDLSDETNIADWLFLKNNGAQALDPRPVRVLTASNRQLFASDFLTNGVDANLINKTVTEPFALESVQAVIWNETRKVKSVLANRSSENDQVIVQPPDEGKDEVVVSGVLEKVTEDRVEINIRGTSRKIFRNLVNAIVTADLEPTKPDGTIGIIQFTDGSSLEGAIESYESDILSVRLDDRNLIKVYAKYISEIEIKSDRIAFLSTMTPIEVDQRSDFGIERGWRKNKSVTGAPLALQGPEPNQLLSFSRGMGVQSYSRLLFTIPEGFDRFQAQVGIAPETEGKGDCELVLLADGIQVWKERLKGLDEAKTIDVDVSGTTQLTITVQPGKQFDLSDHVNICNGKFLKTK